jgi:hypothetical protein
VLDQKKQNTNKTKKEKERKESKTKQNCLRFPRSSLNLGVLGDKTQQDLL